MLNLKTSTLRGAGICFASVMLMVFAFALTSHRAGTMQKSGVARDSEHSIQGYVATVLSSPLGLRRTRSTLSRQVSTSLGSPIFLPDIDVSAKNLRTGVTSAQVVTNPQGYFVLSNFRRARTKSASVVRATRASARIAP